MKYTDEDVIAFNSHLEQEPLTAIAVSMIVNRPIEEVACTNVEQLKQTISDCKDVALLTGFDHSIDDLQRYVLEAVLDQLIYELDAWCHYNLGEEDYHQVDL